MARLAQGSAIIERRLTDGILLLGPRSTSPVSLSGTAIVLWDALANPCNETELISSMRRRFRGDPDRIAEDVRATLATFLDSDLLQVLES